MNRNEWRKYLDELFSGTRETITVKQLGQVIGRTDIKTLEKGIAAGIYPGKAILNMKNGRWQYIIHKWHVAAWLEKEGRMVVNP